MIEGVHLTRADVTLDLYLTANDPTYLQELRTRAKEVGRVRVNDPVPYDVLNETLSEFDIGVFILPPTNFNYEWALPNKLFDYIQARLGIVIGPSAEMRSYVEKYRLGSVAVDYSPKAFAQVLDALSVEEVESWKAASSSSAHELSGESQVEIWDRAVSALAGSHRV